MTGVNPIQTSLAYKAGGVKTNVSDQSKSEAKQEEKAEVKQQPRKDVGADQVFNYLGATSVAPKKSVDPAKYVDAASTERIANFMAAFEDRVATGLQAFDKEFPGVQISDEAKRTVVLGSIE